MQEHNAKLKHAPYVLISFWQRVHGFVVYALQDMAACVLCGADLAAPVVDGNMADGGCMTCHLPHLSVGAALPQQDVPFQPPTGAQAEGLAVGEAVDPSPVCSHGVQDLTP